MDHLYTVNAFVLDRQFTDLFAVIPGVASGIMFLAWLVQRPHNVGNLQLALAHPGRGGAQRHHRVFQEYSAERTAEALQAYRVPKVVARIYDPRRADIGSAQFTAFTDPGYAKIAFSIRVEPYGTRRTLVITETRTATIDARSRRRFVVYWKPIGPFSALIQRLVLRLVKSAAEKRSASNAPTQV